MKRVSAPYSKEWMRRVMDAIMSISDEGLVERYIIGDLAKSEYNRRRALSGYEGKPKKRRAKR